jgi:hypothetical protein
LELLPPKLELGSILSEMLDPETKQNTRPLKTLLLMSKLNTRLQNPLKITRKLRPLRQPPQMPLGQEDKLLMLLRKPTGTSLAKMPQKASLLKLKEKVRLKILLILYLLKKKLN